VKDATTTGDVTVKKLLALCFLVLGLGVGQAHADVIRQFDGAWILTGATGVMVNGTSYDVRFESGSCNSVFNGCDPAEDFLFTSGTLALAASQALLDQVFVGENPGNVDPMQLPGFLDDRPGLTQGCNNGGPSGFSDFRECTALTPYAFSGGTELLAGFATNYGDVFDGDPLMQDHAALSSIVGGGTATSVVQTFAVWSRSPVTAVPEPSTFALLCAGLIALARPSSRRARRIARAQ
jgi:hypothetical protein